MSCRHFVQQVYFHSIKLSGPILPSFTSLAETTGLAYIPLYSPKRSSLQSTKSICPPFSEEEHAKFAKWYEEGYDIPNDRYDQWLDCVHSQSEKKSSSVYETKTPPRLPPPPRPPPSQLVSVVSKFMPQLPQASASTSIKTSGKVLTSAECLQALAQKEREKQQKIEEKEQRQREKKRKQEERAAKKLLQQPRPRGRPRKTTTKGE